MRANYRIVEETSDYLLIEDLGPWDRYSTITNDAENVVKDLNPILRGRQFRYIDSQGRVDEIVVRDGKFFEFRAV